MPQLDDPAASTFLFSGGTIHESSGYKWRRLVSEALYSYPCSSGVSNNLDQMNQVMEFYLALIKYLKKNNIDDSKFTYQGFSVGRNGAGKHCFILKFLAIAQ